MTRPLIFRQASHQDLGAIIDLLQDDRLGGTREDNIRPLRSEYVEAFDAILADANQFQLVVEDEGSIVGTLQISILPGLSRLGMKRGQLEGVRIHSLRRGEGLGQKMIEWATGFCRARGCAAIQLTTDKSRKDAHRFYERLGFVASHEGYKLTL